MRLRMLHDGESKCMSHDNSGQHTTWPPLSDKGRVRSLARPRSPRVPVFCSRQEKRRETGERQGDSARFLLAKRARLLLSLSDALGGQ